MNGDTDFFPFLATKNSKPVMKDVLLHNKLDNPSCRGSKQLIPLGPKIQIPIASV